MSQSNLLKKIDSKIPQWAVGILLAICMMALTGFVARQEFISAHLSEVDKRVVAVEANYQHIKEDLSEIKMILKTRR